MASNATLCQSTHSNPSIFASLSFGILINISVIFDLYEKIFEQSEIILDFNLKDLNDNEKIFDNNYNCNNLNK
ncbi:MAG: hypothetical protein GW770_02580 [Candidatus Altiarchaeum hamiconexum]|nr:hypothetical protein [Candidatus Altarchaeum hamiconexum]